MYQIETEQEIDGRWIAEVPDLPGVLVYGVSRDDAVRKAQALSLHVLAERLEHGEAIPQVENVFSIVRLNTGLRGKVGIEPCVASVGSAVAHRLVGY